jgi:hypothetical protein
MNAVGAVANPALRLKARDWILALWATRLKKVFFNHF